MAGREGDVYCTLLTSDDYLPGALVLAHSLRDNGTRKKLAILVTLDSVGASALTELRNLYDFVIPVERIANPNLENLSRLNRLDLRYSFTKIALWQQVQFRKIVYMDADVVAIRAPDELFDITNPFAAAPDIGWPDCFNTGVMVLNPSMGEYWSLRTLAGTGASFDGADQGLLNQYFEHRPWQRLSFKYNVTPSSSYQYEPAYRHYGSQISAVHFIGREKPWQKGRETTGSGAYKELVGRWWAVHDRHLKPPTPAYDLSREQPLSISVQQHLPASSDTTNSLSHSDPSPAPEDTSTEIPPTEPVDQAEQIDQGLVQAEPTIEPTSFSAPQAEWDPVKSAPPPKSKPEASNWPNEEYTFTADTKLFRPPAEYPEPPKDMWYEVPKEKPKPRQKPKPIFPWEEYMPPATRVFLEDFHQPEPEPEAKPEPIRRSEPAFLDELSVTAADDRSEEALQTPRTPSPRVSSPDVESWQQSFSNAWDEVPGIDNYVRAFKDIRAKRGKVQVLKDIRDDPQILSPSANPYLPTRRESLILTDFPTEIERPSLPVTPAPIKRGTFWGNERDDKSALPAAEGVPDQADWDPVQKLEELRRSSLMSPEILQTPARKIPNRQLPESSAEGPKGILRNKDEGGGLISPSLGGDGTDECRVDTPQLKQHHPHPQQSGRSDPHGLEVTPVVELDQDEPPTAPAPPVLAAGKEKEPKKAPAFRDMDFAPAVTANTAANASDGHCSTEAHEAARLEDLMSPTER